MSEALSQQSGAIVPQMGAGKIMGGDRRPSTMLKQRFVQRLLPIAQKIPQNPTLDIIEEVRDIIPHLAEATAHIDLLSDDDCIWPLIGLERFYKFENLFVDAEACIQQFLSFAFNNFFPTVNPVLALTILTQPPASITWQHSTNPRDGTRQQNPSSCEH